MAGLIDMARDGEDAMASPLMPEENKYPYGLQICLTQHELEKLGVDHSDWEVGATFHLHALAKVTSLSENETENNGKTCDVRLQITHLAGESEDAENEEYDQEFEDGSKLASEGGYLKYKG